MKLKRFALTALVLCICLGAWNLEVDAATEKTTLTSQTYTLTRPVITLSNDFDGGKIGVSWNAVAGAVGYEVHRSEDKSTWSLLTSTTETEILDTTAKAGKIYYYKVRAMAQNADGNSVFSSAKSRTCDLARPEIISMGNSEVSGKISLTWTIVDGAVEYRVYRSTTEDGVYDLVTTTTKTSLTNTSTVAGKTYYYKVQARSSNSAAHSAQSEAAKGICKLPRTVVSLSSTAGSGKITVSWEPVEGAVNYEIFRAEDAGDWTRLTTGTDTKITDTAVQAGVTYSYKVRAVAKKTAADSAFSAEKSKTYVLARPEITVSKDAATGKVVVSWQAVDGAVGYEVYHSTSSDGGYELVNSTTQTSLRDDTAEIGVKYYYKVKAAAENAAGNSTYSSWKSGTYTLAKPEITLSTDAATGKVVVSWRAVDGAAGYEVHRSTKSDGEYKLVGTTSEAGWKDDSTEVGKTYYYKVKAVAEKTAGNSSYSSWKSKVCDLARPEIISMGNSEVSGKISLTWTMVDGAVEYRVYRSTTEDGVYDLVTTTTKTSLTNTSTVAGKTYYYKVQARSSNSAAHSAQSEAAKGICKLPRTVVSLSSTAGSGKITVSWEPVEGAVNYEIFRAEDAGDWTRLTTGTDTKITDTAVQAGVTYSYKVRAVAKKTAADSAFSAEKSKTYVLARPEITVSKDAATGKVVVSWQAVDGAVGYEVYHSTSSDGGYELVNSTTQTSLRDDTAEIGVKYYYKVKAAAENAAGNSTYSSWKSGTYTLAKPEITLSTDAATGKVVVSWRAVDGAAGYEVHRSTKSDGEYKLVGTTSEAGWKDDSTEVGKTYYYKVKAVAEKTAGNSSYSSWKSRTCKLAQPEVTLTNDAATGRVLLSWNAINGAVEYKVYRSDAQSGTYTRIRTTTSLSYMDQSGEMGRTYYYKIRAVAETTAADSAYSSILTGAGQYLNDLTVSIALNAEGKPRLDWNAVQGADSYNVYRTMLPTGEFERIANTQNLYRINSSAASGVTFYYKVVAVDADGKEFQESVNVASITTPLLEEETLVTRYTVAHRVAIYDLPDSDASFEYLPYMSEVQLGLAVTSGSDGAWHRVFYRNELCYIWLEEESEKLVSCKSSFDYYSADKHIQEVLDLAKDISLNWNTVYAHEQSKGEQNADGTYGFDCSGFVSYVFNTVMQRYIPTYRVSADIETLRTMENICGLGYSNELNAVNVELEDLRSGDVLFFSQVDPYDHCGIYLGNGEFAHSSCDWAHTSVIIMPLADMYLEDLVMIRRYLPTHTAPANEVVTVKPTAEDGTLFRTCPLYEKANDESTKLLTLQAGDRVTVLYTGTSWAQIRTADGVVGYVVVRNLSKDGIDTDW